VSAPPTLDVPGWLGAVSPAGRRLVPVHEAAFDVPALHAAMVRTVSGVRWPRVVPVPGEPAGAALQLVSLDLGQLPDGWSVTGGREFTNQP
jgi:hypothetical protein